MRQTKTAGNTTLGVVPDFRRKVQVVYGKSETGNEIISTRPCRCAGAVCSKAGHAAILQLALVGRKLRERRLLGERHILLMAVGWCRMWADRDRGAPFVVTLGHRGDVARPSDYEVAAIRGGIVWAVEPKNGPGGSPGGVGLRVGYLGIPIDINQLSTCYTSSQNRLLSA